MFKRLLALLSILVFCFFKAPASTGSSTAILLEVKGPIGPPTVSYIERALKLASSKKAPLLILQLDTPGGLDASMREIIQHLMTSTVPVATFVAPSGARAASAGTYILYASHIAAMAPGTNLGAATPVQLGGTPLPGSPEWAVQAVRKAESLSSEEALKQNVIDLVATHVPDLLAQLDGREIKLIHETQILHTSGITIQRIEPDWHTKLLSFITNPNVAYILMLIGIYGLIFEFATPGTLLPGIVGAVSLLLSLYAFQVLPISYAGFALMLFGLALMIAEAFAPSFGVLGLGGGLAFIIGSIFLMDTTAPGYGISPVLVGTMGLLNLAFFAFVLGAVIQARKRPVVTGNNTMIGTKAVALEAFEIEGKVKTRGEIWQARSPVAVEAEQDLKITGTDGLVLLVTPLKTTEEK